MEPSDEPSPPRRPRRPRPWLQGGGASQGLVATACLALLVGAVATAGNDAACIRPSSLLPARQAAFCLGPSSALPRLSPSSGRLARCQPPASSPTTGSRSSGYNNVHNTMMMMAKKEEWSPFWLFAFGRGDGGTVKTPPASGTKKKKKQQQQQQQQQQQPKKKKEEDKGWFAFPSPFSSNSQEEQKKEVSRKKKEEDEKQKGWFSLPSFPSFPWSGGFASFNSEWKDQLTLAKKIKKLEKEVARDYIRGEKAKVAQYRYEALRTLEEVERGREGGQAAVEFDPILAGKTKKSQRLEVKDAKLLLRQQQQQQQHLQQQGQGEESMPLKPEDLDSMLQQLESVAKDEQQWARLASACVGAFLGLLLIPSHDFFGVLFVALFMTFLTTTPGLVGDAARMSGYSLLSLTKALSQFEKKFALLRRVREALWEMAEASVPFKFEFKNENSLKNWRNAYKGEGFLHPDIRPAPPMRDSQYVEYLREVKRWVEVEEREVLRALRRKEDERASGVREREKRRERMQKVLVGLWQGSATAATMVGGMVGGMSSKREGGGEGVEGGAGGEGGMEDDVAFLKRFAELEWGRAGGRKGRKEEKGAEEDEEEERDDEMNEEEIFFDEGYVDGGGGQGGGNTSGEGEYNSGGGGGSEGEGGEKGMKMDLGPFAGGIIDRGGA